MLQWRRGVKGELNPGCFSDVCVGSVKKQGVPQDLLRSEKKHKTDWIDRAWV
jgi:hypothetical protein